MLIAAAVCPHPPLLVPEALGGAAGEPPAVLAKVVRQAGKAVRGLLSAGPDLVVVVGGAERDRTYGASAAGSLRPFGVAVTVGQGEPALPLSLTVGRWLLEQAGLANAGAPAGDHPGVLFHALDQRTPPARCLELGAEVAEQAPRVALLAMGDGTARRAQQDPDSPDPQAQDYDEDVAEALAAADCHWLGRLDPALDDEFTVAGRAAWQVLAGAARGARLDGRLLCMTAPYGVTYLVALWQHAAALAATTAGEGRAG